MLASKFIGYYLIIQLVQSILFIDKRRDDAYEFCILPVYNFAAFRTMY